VLVTTNGGGAYLYRNDQLAGNRSVRVRLVGTKSNRDAVGAVAALHVGGGVVLTSTVRTGSSYLSQSELPLTFGMGKKDAAERLVIQWPSGRTEEHKGLKAGRPYECVEAKGLR
jgi:enediyne biosynthesis protein E4